MPLEVGDDREGDPEVGAVGGEPRRLVGEGDDDGKGVAESIEVVAHGGHVFLAWQSSEVAVQDEQQRPATVIAEAERAPFVIDEGDVREWVALADHAGG